MTDRSETDVLDLLLLDAPALPADYGPFVLHHARRRRRIRRFAAVAGACGLALVLISGVLVASRRIPVQTVRLAQSPSPTAPATRAPAPLFDETAIEAAAIRELADRVGNHRDWPTLFILAERYDGITAAPEAQRKADPLTSTEQQALTTALAEYAPVEFLSNRADAYTVGTLAVRDGGALVTLGPIPRFTTDGATFTLSVQVNGLNGQGLTFELTRTGSQWNVIGTTGTAWIS